MTIAKFFDTTMKRRTQAPRWENPHPDRTKGTSRMIFQRSWQKLWCAQLANLAMHLCCVFWPAFVCCAHPKASRNLFFSHFLTSFVHFKAFSVISQLKSLKNLWKWTKKCVFVYSSKPVDMQKLNPKKTNLRYPLRESTSFCMSTSFEE